MPGTARLFLPPSGKLRRRAMDGWWNAVLRPISFSTVHQVARTGCDSQGSRTLLVLVGSWLTTSRRRPVAKAAQPVVGQYTAVVVQAEPRGRSRQVEMF